MDGRHKRKWCNYANPPQVQSLSTNIRRGVEIQLHSGTCVVAHKTRVGRDVTAYLHSFLTYVDTSTRLCLSRPFPGCVPKVHPDWVLGITEGVLSDVYLSSSLDSNGNLCAPACFPSTS